MHNPSIRARVLVAVLVGAVSAAVSLWWHPPTHDPLWVTDLDQTTTAARLLLARANPYRLIGPQLRYPWEWPWLYPVPAAVIVLPLASLVPAVADAVFVACSSALLAFALTRDGWHRLPVFASGAYFYALWSVQWSPLLAAAFLLPWFGAAFAAKPTVGLALFLARPTKAAAIGCAAVCLFSFALLPSWPRDWLSGLGAASHVTSPIFVRGGAIALLGALRWRRPEGRLLVFLALAPQTVSIMETVPLFVIPSTFRESLVLATGTTLAFLLVAVFGPYANLAEATRVTGPIVIAGAYLPALVMVLRRPNNATVTI